MKMILGQLFIKKITKTLQDPVVPVMATIFFHFKIFDWIR